MSCRQFTSQLLAFVREGDLPVAVKRIQAGRHPNRLYHDHDFTEIAMIEEGKPLHLLEESRARLEPGDVIVIPPGVTHAYDEAERMAVTNLICRPQELLPQFFSSELSNMFFDGKVPSELKSGAVFHFDPQTKSAFLSAVSALETELLSLQKGARFRVLARFIDIILLLELRSGAKPDSEAHMRFRLGEAIAYMNQSYSKPIPIDKLCSIVNMSRRNLFRYFRQYTGNSPVEYLMGIRLRHAMNQLLQSDASMAEIAFSCGFYDSNFLGKQFRAHFGMTPREFRRGAIVKR